MSDITERLQDSISGNYFSPRMLADAIDDIDELRTSRDLNHAMAKCALDQRDALLAKLAVAVEALRPFADLLQGHHDLLSDDYPIFGINNALFTAGDLRHAAEALAKIGPVKEGT